MFISCFVLEELKAADDSAVSQSSICSSEEGSSGNHFAVLHSMSFKYQGLCLYKYLSDCGQTADKSVFDKSLAQQGVSRKVSKTSLCPSHFSPLYVKIVQIEVLP